MSLNHLFFNNKKVIFEHFYSYDKWIKYIKTNQKQTYSFVDNKQINFILNKALNNYQVIKFKNNILLIKCLNFKIEFIFDKKERKIKTIMDLKDQPYQLSFEEIKKEDDFGFIGIDGSSWVEGFYDCSIIYYIYDEIIKLNL